MKIDDATEIKREYNTVKLNVFIHSFSPQGN